MSLSKDKALCFRKSGTTYTYYGYTTPPSGHYIGFRSGGVTRYVPLANNTNGGLKVRIANSTYSVARQTATVNLKVEMYSQINFVIMSGKFMSIGFVQIQNRGGSLSETFSQDITVTVEAKLGSFQNNAYSITVPAGEGVFGTVETISLTRQTDSVSHPVQCRIKVTAFGQNFYSDWASYKGTSGGSYSGVMTLYAVVSI